jgi:hypothetical protein
MKGSIMPESSIYDELILMETLGLEPSITHSVHYGDVGGYKNAPEHFLKDGSSFATFHKDGCMEIHHSTESGDSGLKLNHDNKMNLQWVNDAFHIIKQMVDGGHRVKVVGTTDIAPGFKTSLFKNYQGIAKRVAKKHGYHMSPSDYKESDGMATGSFTLSKRTHGFMGEVQKHMLESMTEENNFCGLTKSQAIKKTFGVI